MGQLKDDEKIVNKYSHIFLNIILEANITLNSLQENKVIKKKFPLIYKDLNNIEFNFITYTLCLSYSFKLGYTSLSELVGKFILFRLYNKS